jgi:putative flippase GtrA
LRLAREGAVFALVGASATAVHVLVALATRQGLGLGPMAANFAGYGCAVAVSYLGNARLTFRRSAWRGPQFARFVVVSLIGLAANQAITWSLVNRLGWPFWAGLAVVVALVPALSFAAAKLWAFGRQD